jgi:integrase
MVYDYLVKNNYSFEKVEGRPELLEFDRLISQKLDEPLNKAYKRTLQDLASKLRGELESSGTIPIEFIDSIMLRHNNSTSFNTVRRHLNVLVNHLYENGFSIEKSALKPRKQTEKLHKPIPNIAEVLQLLKDYNYNLYLCCLFTYGCLLRPHREVRLLKWQDFGEDLSYVSVDGSRVKSKRNRVMPVPDYIRKELVMGNANDNIFSNTPIEFNEDYFKTLWSRFKKKCPEIGKHTTIYSFRHSGAIEIFKRTGSLHKLQRAMGHSSLNVSLTYLRGLEVAELKEEDMPMV